MANNVKIYMLTVSPNSGDEQRFSRLEFWLQNSAVINGYWNYIPFVFCIKSQYSASDLMRNLKPVLGSGYLIAEININNMDGQLQTQAWAWFQEPPSLNLSGLPPLSGPPTQPISQLGLGQLFGPTPTKNI